MIFEDGTMDAERYIKEVLPVARKCGNKMLGNNWTYQQDGARPHIYYLSQKWYADHFLHSSRRIVGYRIHLIYRIVDRVQPNVLQIEDQVCVF